MRRPSAGLAVAVLVAGWAVAILLVDPRADVPLIDDWLYSGSVEPLIAGRGLNLGAWMSAIPLAQLAWGAAFAAVAGFSLTVMRLSTLVAAAGGVVAFFALLRSLGMTVERAALGAATLALYPVWFVLGFTFMTDVPFVALVCASLWAVAAALRPADRDDAGARGDAETTRPSRPLLVLGLALAIVAFLVRPVAIAIPAALLIALLRPSRGAGARVDVAGAVAAVATVVLMAAATMVVARVWPRSGGEGGLAYRIERLHWVLEVSPWIYLEAGCSMLAHLGLAALPALIVMQRRLPWRTAAVLLAVAAVASYAAPSAVEALKPHATWSTLELGAVRPLLRVPPAPTPARAAVTVVATVVGLAAAACLLVRAAAVVRLRRASRAWTLLLAFGAASIAICFVLWFFYDRYFLPVVPIAIVLALIDDGEAASGREPVRSAALPRARVAAAALVLLALALVDVTGTRDMLAYARAVNGAVAALRARGVPDDAIDAGYAENGWRLYEHPDRLTPGRDRERDIPHLTGGEHWPFVIANGPVEGYAVVDTISVPTWWAEGDRVVVLRRVDATADVRRP